MGDLRRVRSDHGRGRAVDHHRSSVGPDRRRRDHLPAAPPRSRERRGWLDCPAEAWPSGRRHTPGKRVGGQLPRGFEPLSLRHETRSSTCGFPQAVVRWSVLGPCPLRQGGQATGGQDHDRGQRSTYWLELTRGSFACTCLTIILTVRGVLDACARFSAVLRQRAWNR